MNRKPKKRIRQNKVVEWFARRLKDKRVERGMTQADLGREAEITASYVSILESGRNAPGIDLVDKLAKALGVRVAELLPENDLSESMVVSRNQSRRLFEEAMIVADQQALNLLNPLMALIIESAGKRG